MKYESQGICIHLYTGPEVMTKMKVFVHVHVHTDAGVCNDNGSLYIHPGELKITNLDL